MIELRPFTHDDAVAIEPWFDDPETRRRVGGREWPHEALSLAAPPKRIALLACVDGRPVALVDVEHLDETSFAVVVAPDARRRGIATAVVELLFETELAGHTLSVGVEPDNTASVRLVERLGFRRVGADEHGFVQYVRP